MVLRLLIFTDGLEKRSVIFYKETNPSDVCQSSLTDHMNHTDTRHHKMHGRFGWIESSKNFSCGPDSFQRKNDYGKVKGGPTENLRFVFKDMIQFNRTNILPFLNKNNISILFVGDSLTHEMHDTFDCMAGGIPYSMHYSCYLAHLNNDSTISEEILIAESIARGEGANWAKKLFDESWKDVLINMKSKLKVAVINTGGWWTFSDFPTELDIHFSPNGNLHRILEELTSRGDITIIWRDNTPGGSCYFDSPYEYLFKEHLNLNHIARRALSRFNNTYILPYIWEGSVPRWNQHTGPHDPLHWTLHSDSYAESSVPWMWNEVLLNVLYRKLHLSLP